MKKIWWIALVAVAAAALVSAGTAGAASTATDGVANGSFEDGKKPWKTVNTGPRTWFFYSGCCILAPPPIGEPIS